MKNDQLRRVAAVTAILSAPLAFGNILLGLAAVGFDTGDAYSNPASILSIGSRGASLYRWSMISDMFGFYLLLIPLAVYLWDQLKAKKPGMTSLYSICGLNYILIGAIAAASMTAVAPPMILAYGSASPQTQEILEWLFSSFYQLTFRGLFNPLEMILGGVWWLGMGSLLRHIRPALGIFTLILGAFAWLDALGAIVQVELIFMAGLAGVLLLIPLWALWTGVDLLRCPLVALEG